MAPPKLIPYNREAAVLYAHRWAFGRNPKYYDFEDLGGDCTNFASQCLYAGVDVMNFTPTFGWYYLSAGDRAPAWTGVEYFRNFLVRQELPAFSPGPLARELTIDDLMPGDFVQFNFKGEFFSHTPVVVAVGSPAAPENVLVAAHSNDADYRPLSSYVYQDIRYLHIIGAYPPEREEEPAIPPVLPLSQPVSFEEG